MLGQCRRGGEGTGSVCGGVLLLGQCRRYFEVC